MVELAIRGIRTLDISQLQGTAKAEKAGAPSQKTTGTAGYTVSESLRRALSGGVQTELQIRESRRILQTGGAVLAEIKEVLERVGKLAEQAANGGEIDRGQLQQELERLVGEIERMLDSASVDGTKLFSDADGDQLAWLYLGAVIAGKGFPEGVSQERALEGLRQLMEQVAQGVPLDKAIQSLTNGRFTSLIDFQNQFAGGSAPGLRDFLSGLLTPEAGLTASPLMSLLTGMEGMNFDLLMGLFQAALSVEPPVGTVPEAVPVEAVHAETAPAGAAPEGTGELPADTAATAETAQAADAAETAGTAEITGTAGAVPLSTQSFGALQVMGRDLPGVSYDPSTGALTVSGEADVTVRGTERGADGQAQEVLLTGSGETTLQNVDLSRLTVNTPEARVISQGENTLAEVKMEEGTSLTVDGGGHLHIGQLRADGTNTLRLTGGAVTIEEGEKPLTLPIVVDGPVSLMARAVRVTGPEGKALEPFDIVWKALLPNWSGVTAMELEGKQTRQILQEGDQARLWLNREGYPTHTLVIEGRDKAGKTRVRYAYLRWEQREFQEVAMYPNPFTVTGGEPGLDWVYEEGTRTLRILTDRVISVSGGSGLDADREPFSGRIALADHIGAMELALDGVVCRVEDGRAFSLGRGNDVTLLLPSGTSSRFESGAGCTGISLGDGTSLRVGGGDDPGTITATVGASVQDTDIPILEASQVMDALSFDPAGGREGRRLWVRAGISLQMGDETVILPQFRLSSRALRLDKLNVLTQEYAQAARVIVDEDRRWVSQLQAIYDTLYDQLERSLNSLRSSRGPLGGAAAPVRSTDAAGTILEEMKRSILLQPGHVIETGSPRILRRKLLG